MIDQLLDWCISMGNLRCAFLKNNPKDMTHSEDGSNRGSLKLSGGCFSNSSDQQDVHSKCIASSSLFCDLLIWWFEALLGASDFFFEIAVPFSAGLGLDAWLSPNSSIGVCQTSNCLPCSIMGASLCIIQHRSSSFSHPTNDMSSAHCRWGIWNSYFNRRCRRAISKEGRCCFPDFWLIPRKNVCHKWS